MAACSQTQVIALPVKMAPWKASFAVDTIAAVNGLSEESYLVLKQVLRGTHRCLRPNDLNLVGVTSDSLKVLGIVRLAIGLGILLTSVLDFYMALNFMLPTDGSTGLPSLRSIRIEISPETNTVN